MKNNSQFLFLLLFTLFLLFLSGCAKAPPPNPEVEKSLGLALAECYKSQGLIDSSSIAKMQTPQDVLLYKAIDELGKAAGTHFNPCAGITTNNDLQKVAMQENTKQISAGLAFGQSAVSSTITGLLGWKGLDVAGDLLGGAGDSYTLTAGNDMSISDSFKTSNMGDIFGANNLGGVLSNPKTAEPFFAPISE